MHAYTCYNEWLLHDKLLVLSNVLKTHISLETQYQVTLKACSNTMNTWIGVPVLKQIFRGNSVPPAKRQAQSTRRAYAYHNLTRKSQRIPLIGESPFSWHGENHTKM